MLEWSGWKDPDTVVIFQTILRGVPHGLPHGGVPLQHSYSHFPLGVNYMVNTGASLGLSWSRGPAQIQLSDHQTELGLKDELQGFIDWVYSLLTAQPTPAQM